jgi:hypothetical protein
MAEVDVKITGGGRGILFPVLAPGWPLHLVVISFDLRSQGHSINDEL